jgi:alkylation response protein AidB-like acyl-CoA dehydrogenase
VSFDLNRSEDQRQILDAAGALLATGFPVVRLREGRSDDLAPLAEFGAFSLSVPEAEGGAGFTLVEEALLHALLGRHLVSSRALAATLAAAVARRAGMADLAFAGLERQACLAVASGGDILLLDPANAEMALLFEDRGLALVEIAHARPETGLGRSLAVARMPGDAGVIARSDDARVLATADLLVSAQLLGVAEATRDLAVAYAGLRQQFGKPIGAFQAIKHHCANMAIAAEMLSSQLDMAAIALADGRPDAEFQVAALRRLAPRTALANARTCVQIHGGIGFSAEADAHHFVKQAHLLSRIGEARPILDLPAPMAPLRPAHERT